MEPRGWQGTKQDSCFPGACVLVGETGVYNLLGGEKHFEESVMLEDREVKRTQGLLFRRVREAFPGEWHLRHPDEVRK